MARKVNKLKTAIIGSGNIGTDLLIKVLRSQYLDCTLFAGRRLDSPGMEKAKSLGVSVSDKGIEAILENSNDCQLVFDATSAKDHLYHWPLMEKKGIVAIDMTPSMVGKRIVPAINIEEISKNGNFNMISCGGQSSIPLAYALTKAQKNIEYIEVVSSIASKSAGPGTRINLDEYIENTEAGLRSFTQCNRVKVILVLNPAQPCIDMQTTISAKVENPNMVKVREMVKKMEQKIQSYVPGYKIIVPSVYENNRIVIIVRVKGLGDYLPVYAGNLDIINCAAIVVAEEYVKRYVNME